jgi:Cellulase (glycosyl hydrolase family 5)
MVDHPSSPVARGRHYLARAGRPILPVGAHFVPVEGPDWPWRVGPEVFDRAFQSMAQAGLDAVRIDLFWQAIEPEEGRFDPHHLEQLDRILEAARRHGLWLHPTPFIGGEVGDAFWDVPWREGRHPHGDPEMRRLQAEQLRMLGRRWTSDPVILGWDLTDEPPFWLFPDTTDDDARAWTDQLVGALREADPNHLITIGTSGQDIGGGPFRADVVADRLDFLCVHPYPVYQPELYPDGLLSPRMTHAAAFETALAAGAGRPVMVHEFGASSANFDPEAIASYDRLLEWSSLGRGAVGFFAWCWTDAEPAAYRRAPYVRQPHETQFGVTDWAGNLRPRGRVLSELAATVRRLDLGGFAFEGPAPAEAAMIVPHEFVRPFDPKAYGLSEAPSGTYRPSESIWSPRRGGPRDVLPLTRAWLNGFVMAARAGVELAFARERLDESWPDVHLLLLPAPLASTTISLWHVRTSYWSGAPEFLSRGGTLYLSCSADVAIPEMDDLAGCRLADRAPPNLPAVLRFVEPWGPFRRDDELVLPEGDGTFQTRGVRLRASDARPVALDAQGAPALLVASRGNGHAVTCAYPVELLLAGVSDAHGPNDQSWGIYAGLAALSGSHGRVVADSPEVTTGTLLGPRGGLTAVTNHGPEPMEVELDVTPGTATLTEASGSRLLPSSGERVAVPLDAYGSAIVRWEPDE